MKNSIVCNGVTKQYPGFTLDHISLEVPEGTIMGLIGENGAGKTTLIKLILDLIKRDEGEILIFGKDVKKHGQEIREQIGVVLDQCFFYESLHAKEVNQIMRRIYQAWDEETFFRLLTKYAIVPNKPIKQYSQGMRMKLSLAVALSHQARLLILDEPMNGLDPVVRNEILDLFLEFIMDERNSILLSSHITSDLEKIADYITFIHEGKAVISESKDVLQEDYGVLKCGRDAFPQIDQEDFLGYQKTGFDCRVLVSDRRAMERKYPDMVMDRASLEDIMLFFGRGESK